MKKQPNTTKKHLNMLLRVIMRHQHKAHEHSAKASHKYAEKKGTMKNQEREENGNQQKHKTKAAQD
jgi:hypothetical protein